ncbi:hypothetical protein SAMN04488508_101578 [Aquimarina spongiae]|uniref:Uncharacterized protein n=1 Tax=Aquimarina spongiae TaxID=570521 RepID=A0A1M6B190_9FLAO|nr:hypothetical protein SAMN04488508_101578 [Aquimarina spongiae]
MIFITNINKNIWFILHNFTPKNKINYQNKHYGNRYQISFKSDTGAK